MPLVTASQPSAQLVAAVLAGTRPSGLLDPLELFRYGAQGGLYDWTPWNLSSLYQDSTFTTPVTALEDPVGGILDTSGRGNHLIQPTTTKRPLLKQDAFGNLYLKPDGADDFFYSASTIDFTGTDKITVIAGVTKLSDAASGMFMETSASTDSANAGSFAVGAPYVIGGPGLWGQLRGDTGRSGMRTTGDVAPCSSVVSFKYDLAGAGNTTEVFPRSNGSSASVTFGGADAGGGNFGNHTLYVGARAGTVFFFGGNIYPFMVCGAAVPESNIIKAERWLARNRMQGLVTL